MSQRAKARQAAAQQATEEELAARLARIAEKLPALPGEQRNKHQVDYGGREDHLGHLTHWCGGGTFRCSCGEIAGVTTFVPTPEDAMPCEICKTRKIGEFAERSTGETDD